MPEDKVHFGPGDYEKSFDLGPNQGFACSSLAQMFEFVTELLAWPDLDDRLGIPDAAKKKVTRGPGAWWFRGVDSDQHPVHSALFRVREADYPRGVADANDLDRRLRHEYFQQTRRQFQELTNHNVWDLLAEMQHYRLPTRLLDWSLNLITAAFFAVYYGKEKGKKGQAASPTIWILNPRILSGVCLGEYALNDYAYLEMHGTPKEVEHWRRIPQVKKSKEFGRPNWIYRWFINTPGHYPVNASWTNPRLAAQMGAFTMQTSGDALDKFAEENSKRGRFLLKVRLQLDETALQQAWEQLQSIGIDERYLFPERENLTKSIKEHRKL